MLLAKLILIAGAVFGAVTVNQVTLKANDKNKVCGCTTQLESTAADALQKFADCLDLAAKAGTCTDKVVIAASVNFAFTAADVSASGATLPYFPLTYNQLDAVYTSASDAITTISGKLGDLSIAFDSPTVENDLNKFANKSAPASAKSKATELVLTTDGTPTALYIVYTYAREMTGKISTTQSPPDPNDPTTKSPVTTKSSATEGVSLSLATVMCAALIYSTL